MTVAILVSDLMFQPRVAEAARASGLDVRIADDAVSSERAIDDHPNAVIIDLHAAGIDASRAIVAAKAAGARVLAFGRHTDAAALRAARVAGADIVVPRSQLVEELQPLLAQLSALADETRKLR